MLMEKRQYDFMNTGASKKGLARGMHWVGTPSRAQRDALFADSALAQSAQTVLTEDYMGGEFR